MMMRILDFIFEMENVKKKIKLEWKNSPSGMHVMWAAYP